MKKNSFLLLGHTGFVGRELSNKLKKSNLKFDCYSSKQSVFQNKLISSSNKILDKMVDKNDIIINCVGENIDVKQMFSKNYYFVKKILKSIKKTKKKKFLIHLSSVAVYGSHFHLKNNIIDETTKPNPISIYAKTKLNGEKAIERNQIKNLKYVIIRPSQVVGKNMNAIGFINLAKFVRRKIFVYVNTLHAVRNYVNVNDLTNLLILICKKKKINNQIYIISRYSTLQQIIKFIQRQQKIKSFFNIVIPKSILTFLVTLIRCVYKNFPVNKEIIEGLSITTKVKSNFYNDFKNLKLRNINDYLKNISKLS